MAPRLRDNYTDMGGRATQDAKAEDDDRYVLPKNSDSSNLPFREINGYFDNAGNKLSTLLQLL